MPGERLDALRGNLVLPISECERQAEAIGAVRRPQRFESDSIKAWAADARGGRVEEAFWDFRFQISEVRWSVPEERTRCTVLNLKSEMKNLK
jgi:hypothetical protein